MRIIRVLSCVLLLAAVLSACGGRADVSVDYGTSSIYSKEDMEEAISVIKDEFGRWEGCELHTIEYDTDDCNSAENIQWMNDLNEGQNYTQCIAFLSNFHSPKAGGGAWDADREYKNWQWWLARSDGGKWDLLTWGYG